MRKPIITPTFMIDNPNENATNEKIATYLFLRAIHTSALDIVEKEIEKEKSGSLAS